MKYNTEEEFLKDYNKNDYDLLSVTTDILLLSVSDKDVDNYRKLKEKKYSLWLIKRDTYSFKDKWCLPGDFVKIDEDLDETATRILKSETNLSDIYLEQLYTFSNPKRDPRMRVISTSYIALVDKKRLDVKLPKNASWFDITLFEEKNNVVDIVLDNGEETISFSIKKELRKKFNRWIKMT